MEVLGYGATDSTSCVIAVCVSYMFTTFYLMSICLTPLDIPPLLAFVTYPRPQVYIEGIKHHVFSAQRDSAGPWSLPMVLPLHVRTVSGGMNSDSRRLQTCRFSCLGAFGWLIQLSNPSTNEVHVLAVEYPGYGAWKPRLFDAL